MATVPPGTGIMIMANDQVEVFDNTIEQNQTAGLSIVSYLITDKPIQDEKYDPFCEAIHVHDNRFAANGGKPAGPLGELLAQGPGDPAAGHPLRRHRRPEEAGRRQAARRPGDPHPRQRQGRLRQLRRPGPEGAPPGPDGKAPKIVRDLKAYDGDAAGPGARLDRGPEVSSRRSPRTDGPGSGRSPPGPCCSWLAASGCGSRAARRGSPVAVAGPDARPFEKLSQYALFAGDPAAQEPAEGVIPYDLNSALFSDYAEKYRFIKLPPGTHATYRDDDAFEFPVGTVIAKTFAYPRDARDPSQGRRLIETRILKHEPDGWVGLPYVWNDAQTEATLDVAGDTVDVSWIHTDGRAADQQLHHPQRQPVQGLPQGRRGDDADRPEGAAPQPRFRLSRGDGEPARPLEPSRGTGRCAVPERGAAAGRLGRPEERHARRPRPRLARDQLRPLPQPRRPGAELGARPARLAAQPDRLRHLQAAGGRRHRLGRPACTTSSPASPTNRSWPTGSPRPTRAS